MTDINDPIIWRCELHERMQVTSETVRRWIKAKKLPAPAVPRLRTPSLCRCASRHSKRRPCAGSVLPHGSGLCLIASRISDAATCDSRHTSGR